MRFFLAATAGLMTLGAGAMAQTATPQATSPATPSAGQPAAAAQPVFSMRGGRPTLSLADGNFTAQPVVRMDMDFGGFFGQHAYPGGNPPELMDSSRRGVPDDGINVRRGRLGVQGTYLKDFTYNFTWEFAPGPGNQFDISKNSRIFELQTAWNGLGWGTVRVGAFTLLHTIEFSGSSFESMFLERPAIINLATSLASGDTRLAAGLEARGNRWFAAGYVTGGVLSTQHDDRQRGLVGRAAGMAFNNPDFKLLVGANVATQFHPGAGSSQSVRLRDYPELRLEPTRLFDTGNISAGAATAVGPEVSGMLGPVHFAAEYQHIEVDANRGAPNRNFEGWYIAASVPLIGEPRQYSKSRGVFARPRVKDLDPASGHWGWAELVGRYSTASLNDGAVRGGRQGIATVGVNYYPTSRLRASLQYSNGTVRLDGNDRAFQAVAARLAFNW
jgi:phosphate-selective porin OprO/OprP